MEKEKVIIALEGRSFYSEKEIGTVYVLASELKRCDPHKRIFIHIGENSEFLCRQEIAFPCWGDESDIKEGYRFKECQFSGCAKTSLRERVMETKKIILAALAEAQKTFRFSPHEF